MKKGTFLKSISNGEYVKTKAYLSEHFAVVKLFSDYWLISHRSTGRRIPISATRLKYARVITAELEKSDVDWKTYPYTGALEAIKSCYNIDGSIAG